MKRKEIEELMRKAGADHIALVYNKTDPLGMHCQLKTGILYDCYGHRVPIKQEIWGVVVFENGKPVRYPIEEKINEILFCK